MSVRCFLFALIAFFSIEFSFAQNRIQGTVIDSISRQPIAFAYIVLNDNRTGTSTEVEGNFSLTIPQGYTGSVIISHVSYKRRVVPLSYFSTYTSIALVPEATSLGEFVVTDKRAENPAYRIIRQAVAHRKEHDPDHLKSYEYVSYNKFLATLSTPSKSTDSTLKKIKASDSAKMKKSQKRFLFLDSISKKSHFFLSESVTEKQKINPDKEKEKLLALQVSGYRSPLFTNVATDYQPFSFYKDNISLLGKDFINPVSRGTFSRYDFFLSDTAYQDQDTIYIIKYQPKAKTFFNGLKGMLSISTDEFAIKNVIATSADTLALTRIRIQQNYDKVNGTWFPVQLNTDLDFYNYKLYDRYVIVQHRSFLKDIKIDPPLKRSSFGDVKVELTLPPSKENKLILDRFRNNPLDTKEANTYKTVDSLTRKIRWLDYVFESVATQAVPFSIFEFNLNKLSKLNRYERFRIGAGIYTNNRFSKWLRVGGYAGYGYRDKQWKYGGEVRFNFNQNKDFYFQASYAKDIYETGSSHYNREGQLPGTENLRMWVSSQYDKIEFYKGELGYRLMPDVHVAAFVSRNEIIPTYAYKMFFNNDSINRFLIAETGLTFRYVHDESYMSLRGKKVFLGQRFPVFTLSVVKAAPLFDAQNFNYTRLDFTAKIRINHRYGGRTKFFLSAGWLNGIAPYGKLYNGRGASLTNYFVDDYFQTMGLYEFTVSQYASVFINHNLGNILINKKYSKPELVLYHNMGIGQLENASAHSGIILQPFDQGFYESGIGLNNIFRGNYFNVAYWGIGGAVFYRYGPYQFAKQENNIFAKLTISFSF
ncbi:MAG TPA: hypothetical protein DGG95_09950 [Cytophagales bacterium]|jgi:hypothetical protein|nr:hypothetical protein [Cytophagales bacterium]